MADASAAICFMAHSGGRDNARDDANARLVAAAPTLLAALLDAEDALFRCEFAGQGGGAVQASLLNVRAAIRKAVAGDA